MRVLPCPSGFQFSTDVNSGVSDCNQLLASVTTSCNIVNGTVTASGNLWIAYDISCLRFLCHSLRAVSFKRHAPVDHGIEHHPGAPGVRSETRCTRFAQGSPVLRTLLKNSVLISTLWGCRDNF